MTTLEGNKLIAEFDDCVSIKPKEKIYKYEIDGDSWALEGLKYHSSWDWLMPVVEKIEGIENSEGLFEVYIFKRCCDIQTTDGDDHIIEITSAPNKITAVWMAVIQLIQWYNSQPKTDNNDK